MNVLKVNNYSLEEGEGSVWAKELGKGGGGGVGGATGPRRQIAGRDYDHIDFCHGCRGGEHSKKGGLMRCALCPVAMHHDCACHAVGQKAGTNLAVSFGNSWPCPHHQCSVCARKAGAAGGLLFRCLSCPKVSHCSETSTASTHVKLRPITSTYVSFRSDL